MFKITMCLEQVSVFNNSLLVYFDTFDNFKKDCLSLGLTTPSVFDVAYFDDENSYIILCNNQTAMPLELVEFCKNLIDRKDDLIKAKIERNEITELTFDEKKEQAKQEINALCFAARSSVSGTVDSNKTASWAIYRDLANRFKLDLLTDVEKTCLEKEISLRQVEGETLVSFVDKILQNSELFLKATTTITGAEKRANLDIDQSQNEKSLTAAIQKLKDTLKVLE